MTSLVRPVVAVLLLAWLGACAPATPDPSPAATTSQASAPSSSEATSASPTSTPEEEPACLEVAPDASVVADLQLVVNNANTEPALRWMAPTVGVVHAGGDQGPRTADQAGLDLSDFLIGDAGTLPAQYDFALPETSLDAYRAGGYGAYFPPSALVGRGTDGHVVAFSFDCNGLIDTLLLVPDENLLL